MCTSAYNKQQYCDYCKQVYFEENEQFLDGKVWIGCDNDRCKKWNHVDCEIHINNNEALKNIEEDQKYYCQACSKNKKFGGKSTGGKGTVSKVAKRQDSDEERSADQHSQENENMKPRDDQIQPKVLQSLENVKPFSLVEDVQMQEETSVLEQPLAMVKADP